MSGSSQAISVCISPPTENAPSATLKLPPMRLQAFETDTRPSAKSSVTGRSGLGKNASRRVPSALVASTSCQW
jgi:hypothetical protein